MIASSAKSNSPFTTLLEVVVGDLGFGELRVCRRSLFTLPWFSATVFG